MRATARAQDVRIVDSVDDPVQRVPADVVAPTLGLDGRPSSALSQRIKCVTNQSRAEFAAFSKSLT
jgi:hypothetical protein